MDTGLRKLDSWRLERRSKRFLDIGFSFSSLLQPQTSWPGFELVYALCCYPMSGWLNNCMNVFTSDWSAYIKFICVLHCSIVYLLNYLLHCLFASYNNTTVLQISDIEIRYCVHFWHSDAHSDFLFKTNPTQEFGNKAVGVSTFT